MTVGTVVLAATAAACTSPDLSPVTSGAPDDGDDGSGAAGGSQPDEAPVPPDGAPGSGDDPSPPGGSSPPSDPHGPDGEVPACGDGDVRDIDAVIGDQLAAFADDDYERALEFASRDFRAAIDAEGLAGIIEQGYPVASDAASHETGTCVQPTPATAEVLVRVTARDGARGDLVYRLVDETDGWRIAGAIQVGDGGDDGTVVTAAAAPRASAA